MIWGGVFNILLCKDGSPLWFIQPYLLLCIISPILNTFFDSSSLRDLVRIYLLFGFIVFGLGFIGNYAIAKNGYTLLCFAYLYLIGRGLRRYNKKIKEINNLRQYLLMFYALIVFVILTFKYSENKYLSMIAGGFFAYNSPLMYLYSIVIFYLFTFITLENKVINYIAKGSFSIYLLASNPFIMTWTTNKALALYNSNSSPYLTFLLCFLFSLAICVVCLTIDMIVRPIIIHPIFKVCEDLSNRKISLFKNFL